MTNLEHIQSKTINNNVDMVNKNEKLENCFSVKNLPYPKNKIYECPGKRKVQIMERIKDYFLDNYTEGKDYILYNNIQKGKMVIRGKIKTIHACGHFRCITNFTMSINIKNNKIKIKYLKLEDAIESPEICNYNNGSKTKIDKRLNELEEDLVYYINNEEKDW